MHSTTSYKFGDVVLVNFPFTDQTSSKLRPVVVISNSDQAGQHRDVIVLAITSRVHAPTHHDFLVEDWADAGLVKLSAFKPVIATLDKMIIRRALGALTARDLDTLDVLLAATIGPS